MKEIIFIYIIVIAIVIAVWAIFMNKKSQLKRYTLIRIGMSVNQMLEIMGKGYSVSSLKNNRQKYEWRINGSSYTYRGMRTYSGVRKVEIFVKDGLVEEIKPHNI